MNPPPEIIPHGFGLVYSQWHSDDDVTLVLDYVQHALLLAGQNRSAGPVDGPSSSKKPAHGTGQDLD